MSGISDGKFAGHSQSALAPITPDGGPLRENWHGPHRPLERSARGLEADIFSGIPRVTGIPRMGNKIATNYMIRTGQEKI